MRNNKRINIIDILTFIMYYNRNQVADDGPIVLKFIVQPEPKTMELLNYLNNAEVMRRINEASFNVKFERITPKRREMLEREKVRGLPVMETPDNKYVVGPTEIIRQLSNNILKKRADGPQRREAKHRVGLPHDDVDITDYLCDEIYEGVGRRTGKRGSQLVVPTEKEGGQGEGFDPDKEMRKFRRPNHWIQRNNDDDDDKNDVDDDIADAPVMPARQSNRKQAAMPPKNNNPRRQQRQNINNDYGSDNDDNEANDNIPMNDNPIDTYNEMVGGANDDDSKMMRALLAGMGSASTHNIGS